MWVRTVAFLRLALLALGSVFWAGMAHAGIIEIALDHYFVSVEKPRANYFDGKLLTADDLDQEQSYKGSGKRYLPPTDLPLTEVLQAEGFASVVLLLQEQIVSANYFSAANPDNRFGDNFIVLDPQHGTWRGRLFVEELGDIRQGVYDELSGSYRGFAASTRTQSAAADATRDRWHGSFAHQTNRLSCARLGIGIQTQLKLFHRMHSTSTVCRLIFRWRRGGWKLCFPRKGTQARRRGDAHISMHNVARRCIMCSPVHPANIEVGAVM